jgi:hypothetical protein
MASWSEFAAAEPDFAERVRRLFTTQKHMTLATLRRDGSPRISGVEISFERGHLRLGMMPGSRKALDLLRDPRLALHSPAVDPPHGDPGAWEGDAKISGRAVEDTGKDPADAVHQFTIDLAEVVLTRVGAPADHLLIQWWTEQGGLRTRRRS